MYRYFFSLSILLLISIICSSQSLTGTNGYFIIPSADLQPDRTIYLGTNLIHREYKKWGSPDHHAMNFYTTITYLPFLEISVRFNRLIGLEDYSSTVGDRMASARVLLMSEQGWYPSVLIGFQNFFTTISSGAASHFNSTYLVITRNIPFQKYLHRVGLTAGYGHKAFRAADYQFIGFFGGINVVPEFFKNGELMIEYDAEKWNAGIKITFFDHLVILAGTEGLKAFTGGISYRLVLP